jgi:hypothetical protein
VAAERLSVRQRLAAVRALCGPGVGRHRVKVRLVRRGPQAQRTANA